MFKTIQECRLDLVSHTKAVETKVYIEDPSLMEGVNGPCYWTDNVDFMPCSAARVSFGNEDKTGDNVEADIKLMKYLADNQHMTPFEYQHATFLVECPLFIRSQIHRHRAFSYNEISRRYTSEDLEFWIPDKWRGQHKTSKQASSDEVVTNIHRVLEAEGKTYEADVDPFLLYQNRMKTNLKLYEDLVSNGVAREIARAVLPQALLTKFYMGGNLRSWAHFIALRRDPHAQFEVQVIAEKIAAKLKELWPESCNALGI